MDDEIPSSSLPLPTGSSSPTAKSQFKSISPDLSTIPRILILSAHFKGDEERDVETTLRRHGALLTSDASKAQLFIGKVGTKRRAEFELRSRKLKAEEVIETKRTASVAKYKTTRKRRKISGTQVKPISIDSESSAGEETEDEAIDEASTDGEGPASKRDTPFTPPTKSEKRSTAPPAMFANPTGEDIVWVIKTNWLHDCVTAGSLVPLGDHLVYKGKVLERPTSPKPYHQPAATCLSSPTPEVTPASQNAFAIRPQTGQSILERAKSDRFGTVSSSNYQRYRSRDHGSHRFEGKAFMSTAQQAGHTPSQLVHPPQQTTSEYDGEDSDIPPPPPWVKKRVKYACQRFTPLNCPNEDFIELLKKIRIARILIDDQIGVRAYSTSIAAIASYPYKFIYPHEILRLPGCENKIATLWFEWKNTGKIRAVEDFENDETMKVLRLFYDILGVGAKTSRQFFYQNNWTELDDIIEFGWHDLDRVQQIGVKYYDEFLDPIPRAEVEQIASVVHKHAIRARDTRISVTIVGGYRRGKEASGDVDIIVSHPDLEATANLIKDMVESLEDAEWITHTLTMSLNGTNRGQSTLPFRTTKASGGGFDTLDKALVVWQNPLWPTKEDDKKDNPSAKNPNMHRRVDIIVSPWRTVGCAVLGWSGGTTFQRDLRRYTKYVRGWKFDSSGIRSRHTGEVIQLEGPDGVQGTAEDAERKVFEGLGLEFIPPDQRCTN
ncbi:Nucleotidyltransferase [Lindgomyces ingoldianus]|uniref:Nucleotidyltransferase n=1 Tax=Lindgomyces ingoldianus TaxID=673940 RepID=A0ACB6RFW7_9PLEO|nr:Nucleotidyltransferase [Lindgomyces ingoldianus]KAF2477387.1 Nucleotidyltransferase [Lindgomyces ingoldianus]